MIRNGRWIMWHLIANKFPGARLRQTSPDYTLQAPKEDV